MSAIKIKQQTSPSRCEICHQNDLFDALNNHCMRCAEVVKIDAINQAISKNFAANNEVLLNRFGLKCGYVISLISFFYVLVCMHFQGYPLDLKRCFGLLIMAVLLSSPVAMLGIFVSFAIGQKLSAISLIRKKCLTAMITFSIIIIFLFVINRIL